jgi:hypothetical protein
MRKLWIPLVLGSLFVTSFTTSVDLAPAKITPPTDELFAELQEYRVTSHHEVSQVLETFVVGLEIVNLTWSAIKAIFSSKTKTEIVGRITNLGFDQMESSTIVQMYKGLPETKFDAFKTMVMNQAEVPADKRESFNDWWDLALFSESQTWQL